MLEGIKEAITRNLINVTDYADEEMQKDGLRLNDIFEAVASGKIIEDYPDDFPFPSCLIYGRNLRGQPIHCCLGI